MGRQDARQKKYRETRRKTKEIWRDKTQDEKKNRET